MRNAIQKRSFGFIDQKEVFEYTFFNKSGMSVSAINYGGALTDISVINKRGNLENIILRFDSLADYLNPVNPYFGSLIGRYSNRIKDASFRLDNQIYRLGKNDNGNTLHGGFIGFDKVIWDIIPLADNSGIMLHYTSYDTDEGFPGELVVRVSYTLTDDNCLVIDYLATTNKPTPVSLTSHPYFNLSGGTDTTILNHILKIYGTQYVETGSMLLPTGKILNVANTPFDFRQQKRIGRDIQSLPMGFDHSWVLNSNLLTHNQLYLAAEVFEFQSGRSLLVYTDQPAVHFYSGNFLNGTLSSNQGARKFVQHAGFCLETQSYPDSPNNNNFPNSILYPGEKYNSSTVYKFSVNDY